MPSLIQPSFAKGEFAPSLYGRVDTQAYSSALRTARNVIVHPYGGVSNRPGTDFIGPCKNHTGTTRLIKFQFKTTDTYVIEMGDLYMRFIRNGGHVLEADKTITAITAASPGVVTSASHGYANGDEVYLDTIVGMTELNQRRFIVANKTTNTFDLTTQFDGSNVDTSGYTAYSSAGTAAKVYEVTTTYAQADLAELKFIQSADTITFTHPSYPVRELTRTAHTSWTLADVSFIPTQVEPDSMTVAQQGTTGSTTYKYRVTAIGANTFEESLSALNNSTSTPESATAANPVVVTDTSHGFANGEIIKITGFNEMTEVNNRRFKVANKNANDYELTDPHDGTNEDGSGYAAETTGGTSVQCHVQITNGNATLSTTNYIAIAWGATALAQRYAVYRETNGVYGLLGETEDNNWDDDGAISPDVSDSPPRYNQPFRATDEYPGTTGFYEQRQVFGGANENPDTTAYSQTGNFKNFTVSTPVKADDAITATLPSSEVNEIRHFVAGNDLLVLTSGGEWRVNAGTEGGFEAATLRQKPQSYWGCSHIPPVTIGDQTLFFEFNKTILRSMGYSLEIDGYAGTDMTILANHLFGDYPAVEAAYARLPDPVIACVRSDGKMPVLTFNKAQEVIGWANWDTLGKYKSVTSVLPSITSTDQALYMVVERSINSQTMRYIEKTHSRRFTDVRDAYFVDAGVTQDTPITLTAASIANPVQITAAAHGLSDGNEIDIFDIKWVSAFDALDNETQPAQLNNGRFLINDVATNTMTLAKPSSNIHVTAITKASPAAVTAATAHGLTTGDKVVLNNTGGMTEVNNITFTITVTSTTEFTLGVDSSAYTTYTSGGKVHATIDGSAFVAYVSDGELYKTVTEIGGLWHLEGENVAVLADGNVISGHTVSSGKITLTTAASRAHIGLKYIADVETLNIEAPQGTVQDKKKQIPEVTIRFEKTRGILVGPSTALLSEMKQREDEAYGEPTALLTGDKAIPLEPSWNSHGRVFIRQRNPLPMTILAVIPTVEIGDD